MRSDLSSSSSRRKRGRSRIRTSTGTSSSTSSPSPCTCTGTSRSTGINRTCRGGRPNNGILMIRTRFLGQCSKRPAPDPKLHLRYPVGAYVQLKDLRDPRLWDAFPWAVGPSTYGGPWVVVNGILSRPTMVLITAKVLGTLLMINAGPASGPEYLRI